MIRLLNWYVYPNNTPPMKGNLVIKDVPGAGYPKKSKSYIAVTKIDSKFKYDPNQQVIYSWIEVTSMKEVEEMKDNLLTRFNKHVEDLELHEMKNKALEG